MKEFKPESILIRLSVERSAARLSESELRRYQNEKVKNAEMLIDDPDFIPEFTDDLTGDLLEMAWETVKAGIESARAKHYANVSGKKKSSSAENPNGTHRVPIDPPEGTHRPPNTYIQTDIHTDNHTDILPAEPDNHPQQDDNKGQPQKEKKKFIPPTVEEVRQYCQERNNTVQPERFVNYYNSNGWMVGRNHMKDWRAAVRTWEQNQKEGTKHGGYTGNQGEAGNDSRTDYSFLRDEIINL